MKENKFTIGYDVRIVGRLVRFMAGLIPLILILMDIFILDTPNPEIPPIILFRDTVLYLLVVVAAYTIGFYILSDRALNLLGRVNPWIPTAIFVGPPIIVAIFSLGPDAFRLGLGSYVAVTSILAAAMGYGGCEVVALPSLFFKQRHVVYCPSNIVDVIEDAAVRNTRKRSPNNDPRADINSV
jgi:hypothetical protein